MAQLARIARLPIEPEDVAIRTDYRVGAITFGHSDLAKRQADLVGGGVTEIVIRKSSSVVYRAEARS